MPRRSYVYVFERDSLSEKLMESSTIQPGKNRTLMNNVLRNVVILSKFPEILSVCIIKAHNLILRSWVSFFF